MNVATLPYAPDTVLIAIEKKRCEQSLSEFVKAAWHVIEPSNPYVHNWHIDFICYHLEAIAAGVELDDGTVYNRLLANVPPGTMKSLLFGVFFPAWVWGPKNKPSKRFLSVTHSQELTERDTDNTRTLVKSEWYQNHWGDRVVIKRDTVDLLSTTARGFRQAATWSNVTGKRADYVIVDDPHSVKTAESDAERSRTVRLFREAIPTRLVNPVKSAILVVMQRLHESDVSGAILDLNLGYDHIMLPMRYDPGRAFPTKLGVEDPRTEEGELLFPERFPEEVVDRDEAALGEYATAGQMQQIPAPRGGGIIKSEYWQPWRLERYPSTEIVIGSLDTAYTDKQENDPSAMTTWGIFRTPDGTDATRSVDRFGRVIDLTASDRGPEYMQPAPKVMMTYAWADKLEFHELLQKTVKTCRDMRVDILLIENKAAGHSVAQELKRLFTGEGFQVVMYDPKSRDKVSRAYSIQHLFQEGMVYAPTNTEGSLYKSWAQGVIDECGVFPKGKHDDRVDTVTMALNYMRGIGLLTRTTERLQEVEEASRVRMHKDGGNIYGV